MCSEYFIARRNYLNFKIDSWPWKMCNTKIKIWLINLSKQKSLLRSRSIRYELCDGDAIPLVVRRHPRNVRPWSALSAAGWPFRDPRPRRRNAAPLDEELVWTTNKFLPLASKVLFLKLCPYRKTHYLRQILSNTIQ